MMKKFTVVAITAVFIAACCIAVTSCGEEKDSVDSFPPEVQQQLEEVMNEVMADNGIPGAIVYVEVPGEGKWEAALGLSDIETEEAMDLANAFRVGSITKTFTATVVLQLVDEGQLSLDDTLASFAMEPSVPGSDEITVRMLLNHTSGLFEYTADEGFQELQAEDLLRKWAPGELVAFAASHEPYFPPGEGWQYSNTNFILQGMIVEQVTGNPLKDEIAARIAGELGLARTSLPTQPRLSGEHSHGYLYARDMGDAQDGGGDELLDVTDSFDPSWSWGAGAMISDLEDLGKWVKALVGGDLLSDEVQRQRLTTVEAWQGSDYGLGIAEYDGFWGHPGDLPGFSSAMMYNPDSGALIILNLNKNPNDIDFAAYTTFTQLVEVLSPGSGDGD
ncbi:MAG: beta-lactamase family protein [Actinobacteria bacterium]|nr:beta-lactamase family protein [Actinomycetota bacterium]